MIVGDKELNLMKPFVAFDVRPKHPHVRVQPVAKIARWGLDQKEGHASTALGLWRRVSPNPALRCPISVIPH